MFNFNTAVILIWDNTDGSDYGNNTGSLVFTFNATHNSSAACVLVIKDNIFEFTEMLEATQRLLGQPSSPLVSLVSTSVITILDDDGKSKTNTHTVHLFIGEFF